MSNVNVAKFQIVQMYDAHWTRYLIEAGMLDYADMLDDFMRDQDSLSDAKVIKLRDYMASCAAQKD